MDVVRAVIPASFKALIVMASPRAFARESVVSPFMSAAFGSAPAPSRTFTARATSSPPVNERHETERRPSLKVTRHDIRASVQEGEVLRRAKKAAASSALLRISAWADVDP